MSLLSDIRCGKSCAVRDVRIFGVLLRPSGQIEVISPFIDGLVCPVRIDVVCRLRAFLDFPS